MISVRLRGTSFRSCAETLSRVLTKGAAAARAAPVLTRLRRESFHWFVSATFTPPHRADAVRERSRACGKVLSGRQLLPVPAARATTVIDPPPWASPHDARRGPG